MLMQRGGLVFHSPRRRHLNVMTLGTVPGAGPEQGLTPVQSSKLDISPVSSQVITNRALLHSSDSSPLAPTMRILSPEMQT